MTTRPASSRTDTTPKSAADCGARAADGSIGLTGATPSFKPGDP
jgi:hypothetical protein